ncbi:MAG TPA: sulfatase [Anaerolineae bacterium]|nr:sulfatase [Anaerolineae bacterium]
MNVILIFSDTLRVDFLGCYGNGWIHTPYIDRFAQDAIVFDRAYCGSFPTVPCRNDVLTGRWTLTYKPWAPLGTDEVVLAEVLNEAGCLTALFADTPHPFAPGFNYQRGFQAWELLRGQEHDPWKTAPAEVALPCSPEKLRGGARGAAFKYLQNVAWRRSEEDYFPARTMRAAASWLEENRGRPFFLYVDTFDPHEPWDPPAHYLAHYEPEQYQGEQVIYPRYDRWADFMTEAELKHCRNLYAGEVSLVDRWVGFLLERVEDLGLLEETAIIITTDHGFYLGEHGYVGKSIIRGNQHQSLPLYPEVARVPLIVRLPGGRGHRRPRAFAQPVDFMPTILELMGAAVPGSVQGKSLVPVFEGQDDLRPFAVSSPTLSGSHVDLPHPTNRTSVTADEWMLILGAQVDSASAETTSMVDSLRREVTILEGPVGPELYHLPSDPWCTHNVIADHKDVARRLQAGLVVFLRDAGLREDHLPYFAATPPEMRG